MKLELPPSLFEGREERAEYDEEKRVAIICVENEIERHKGIKIFFDDGWKTGYERRSTKFIIDIYCKMFYYELNDDPRRLPAVINGEYIYQMYEKDTLLVGKDYLLFQISDLEEKYKKLEEKCKKLEEKSKKVDNITTLFSKIEFSPKKKELPPKKKKLSPKKKELPPSRFTKEIYDHISHRHMTEIPYPFDYIEERTEKHINKYIINLYSEDERDSNCLIWYDLHSHNLLLKDSKGIIYEDLYDSSYEINRQFGRYLEKYNIKDLSSLPLNIYVGGL